MATVRKVKKAQDGLCKWSSKRGGGVSCGRRGGPKTEEWKAPRIKFGRSKDEEPEPPKKSKPVYPAKGTPVWHGEWDFDESIPKNLKSGFSYRSQMKKGGKVVKKSAPKAKSGYKTSKKKK